MELQFDDRDTLVVPAVVTPPSVIGEDQTHSSTVITISKANKLWRDVQGLGTPCYGIPVCSVVLQSPSCTVERQIRPYPTNTRMAGFSIGKVIKNGLSALSQSAETVVRAFCDAWEQRDLERVLGLMAEDVSYQNVPQPVMRGRAQARRFIGPILRETRAIKFVVLNVVVSEEAGLVLTERLDQLYYPSGLIEIPLMGIFVVRNGQIVQWRDYADSATVARGFAGAGVNLTLDPAD